MGRGLGLDTLADPWPPRDLGDFARGGNIGVFAERWRWIEGQMLPRWRALADGQPARVRHLLQSLMLGGDPLALPGLPALKVRLGIFQAIGLRNWLPKAARNAERRKERKASR